MKRISMNHDNKDRIICVSDIGKHKFYYQPVGTKERLWLFDTKTFSGSVFGFFRKHGRNLEGIGFSMTIKELYEAGNGRNKKISKIMDRIPGQIEYVLREGNEQIEMPFVVTKTHHHCREDDIDRAA